MEQLASRGFVGGHARLSNRSAIHSRPASGRGRRGSFSSFGIRISNTMPRYDAQRIEPKWQAYWDQHQTFATGPFDPAKEKLYVLDMFPYRSGWKESDRPRAANLRTADSGRCRVAR